MHEHWKPKVLLPEKYHRTIDLPKRRKTPLPQHRFKRVFLTSMITPEMRKQEIALTAARSLTYGLRIPPHDIYPNKYKAINDRLRDVTHTKSYKLSSK